MLCSVQSDDSEPMAGDDNIPAVYSGELGGSVRFSIFGVSVEAKAEVEVHKNKLSMLKASMEAEFSPVQIRSSMYLDFTPCEDEFSWG